MSKCMFETKKIGIALPHWSRYYDQQFVNSFFGLRWPTDFQSVILTPVTDGRIDAIRNELCQQAIMHDCSHVFWCDTDQTYPDDTLLKLVNHDLDIVCAKVHRRKPPFDPLLKRINPNKEDKELPYIDVPIDEWAYSQNQLVEVDATGFGCNLMKTEVLLKIDRPWFDFELYKKPVVGEDVYFWRKAKAKGFKIFVDCTIDIGHIGVAIVKSNTFFEYRKMFGHDHKNMG